MKMKIQLIVGIAILLFLFFPENMYAGHGMEMQQQEPETRFMFWAFILGGFSAISLVLGSVLGLLWQPRPKITAAFTAFGAGALLAALSVELIAPTVIEFVEQKNLAGVQGHDKFLEFVFLLGGCVLGGILFYFLNEALNSKGGYLRKVSTTISFFNHQRNKRFRLALKHLSKIKLFRSVPHSHLDVLIQHMRHAHIKKGKHLFHAGEMASRIFIIESGEVEIMQEGNGIKKLSAGNILGETSMLMHEPSVYDAIAVTDLRVFELSQHDFFYLIEVCPELQEIVKAESQQELLLIHPNHNENSVTHQESEEWANNASDHLHHTAYVPSQTEINDAAKKTGSAPLSIWLGIFLDGIPESFVIGAGFLLILTAKLSSGAVIFTDVIPYTLIAGLFLSNFPEAMSSSIGMKKMGWKAPKILMLWSSLMLMTAIGAVFGYYYGAQIPNYIEIGVEGMASGAMLTMIAQTMIPEAVHIGGSKVTGLSVLAGYLSAVAFKIFE